jgi:hypothetical protein
MVLATNLLRDNVEELLAMLRVYNTRLSGSDVFLIPGLPPEISGTYIGLHYTERRTKYILETHIYLRPMQYSDAVINLPITTGGGGVMLGNSTSGVQFEPPSAFREIGYNINSSSMFIDYLFSYNEASIRRTANWREDDVQQLRLAPPTTVV